MVSFGSFGSFGGFGGFFAGGGGGGYGRERGVVADAITGGNDRHGCCVSVLGAYAVVARVVVGVCAGGGLVLGVEGG